MAQYPVTPFPQLPYILEPQWNTIISRADAGNEQRKQKATYARYNVTLTYNALTQTNIDLLYAFYMARKGSYEAFHFYTLDSYTWTDLWVGLGDGIETTFDIPGQSTSSQIMYLNGLSTIEFSAVSGGGDSDSDRVIFNVAPAAGTIITCTFTGYMRIRCRFDSDNMSREAFMGALYKTGLKLKGLNPAEL